MSICVALFHAAVNCVLNKHKKKSMNKCIGLERKKFTRQKKKNFLVAGAKVVMIQMSNKTKLEFSPIFFLLEESYNL